MESLVRWRYDAILRTTLDLGDEAHHIAKTVAREQKRSLGSVVSEFILRRNLSPDAGHDVLSKASGFPTFRCIRQVTSSEVRALTN